MYASYFLQETKKTLLLLSFLFHLLLFFLYLYFVKHPDTAYGHNTVHECFKHWLFRSISFRNALLWPSYIYLSIQLVKPNYPAVPLPMQHHRFLETHPVCHHISFTTVVAILLCITSGFWCLFFFSCEDYDDSNLRPELIQISPMQRYWQ